MDHQEGHHAKHDCKKGGRSQRPGLAPIPPHTLSSLHSLGHMVEQLGPEEIEVPSSEPLSMWAEGWGRHLPLETERLAVCMVQGCGRSPG